MSYHGIVLTVALAGLLLGIAFYYLKNKNGGEDEQTS